MTEKVSAIEEETGPGTVKAAAPEKDTHPVPALRQKAQATAPEAKTKTRRLWLGALGAVLVMAAGLALYVQPWVAKATAVTVETVTLAPVTRVLAVNGRIAAERSVDVRPLVSGTLAEVFVAEGDEVQLGTELARIDPTAQQAVLRQAVAGLDAALVAQEGARATYTRTLALGANAARTTLDSAERAVQSAAQEVARGTALVDQAQIQLSRFTIGAPLGGTVLVLNVDPGQVVDPSTNLLTLADLSALVVETDVDEAYATQIRKGQDASLQLAGEAEVRAGHVSFVSQRVDAATGGLALKLTLEDPLSAPIGLTVTANIVVDSRAAAITVPRAAIVTDAQGTAVFVVEEGVARRRAVEVIDWPAARLIVTDGLDPGVSLIADATGLADGQAVSEVLP